MENYTTKSAYLYCLDLCTNPDAANEIEQSFPRCATNLAEFLDRYTQWISGENRPIPEDTCNDGCLSVSSQTSSTLLSSRSKLLATQAKYFILSGYVKNLHYLFFF